MFWCSVHMYQVCNYSILQLIEFCENHGRRVEIEDTDRDFAKSRTADRERVFRPSLTVGRVPLRLAQQCGLKKNLETFEK